MSDTINIGIDLGTTKSIVAVFERGTVRVCRHNSTHDDLLPSAVMIKKDQQIVGRKAREQAFGAQSKDVAFAFKRKMGTAERFSFRHAEQEYSAVDLSALLLKELRERHLDGNPMEAAVITVPASFDLRQSAATVEAGKRAGIRQVINLQEPIAASLAYANMLAKEELPDSPWLVYDLGGGTFDAAIVQIEHGELKVLDHEGDNYLGGLDLDETIVREFIFPRLMTDFGLEADDFGQFTSKTGRYRHIYGKYMGAAEEAKKELSARTSATLDFEFSMDSDDTEYFTETITRTDFERILRPWVDRSIDLVKRLLTRSRFQPGDLAYVLMVGGSTYIPFVRNRVSELLGLPIRHDIDPVQAIAIGAAHFAATRPKKLDATESSLPLLPPRVSIKLAYQRVTQDCEEILAGRVEGQTEGLSYRIEREDGGFDSGLKPLTKRINEDLPLVPDSFNVFQFRVVDERGSLVLVDVSEITIAHGEVIAPDQPLTADVCIAVDDLTWETTKLELVFKRKTPLPAKCKLQLETTKSVARGSRERVVFEVCEGDSESPIEAAKPFGTLEITGTMLKEDLRRGSPIGCWVEINESRVLTVSAEIEQTDQKFEQIFTPGEAVVTVDELGKRTVDMLERINDAMGKASAEEAFERCQRLRELQRRADKVSDEVDVMGPDDASDRRYQLDEELRQLAGEYHCLESGSRFVELESQLEEALNATEEIVEENGSELDQRRLADSHQEALSARQKRSESALKAAIEQINSIRWSNLWRTPEFLIQVFEDLSQNRYSQFSNLEMADAYIRSGRQAISGQDWLRLRDVDFGLIRLLPDREHREFCDLRGIRMRDS